MAVGDGLGRSRGDGEAVGLERWGVRGELQGAGSKVKGKTHFWLKHWKSASVMTWEHKEKHLMAET